MRWTFVKEIGSVVFLHTKGSQLFITGSPIFITWLLYWSGIKHVKLLTLNVIKCVAVYCSRLKIGSIPQLEGHKCIRFYTCKLCLFTPKHKALIL